MGSGSDVRRDNHTLVPRIHTSIHSTEKSRVSAICVVGVLGWKSAILNTQDCLRLNKEKEKKKKEVQYKT